MRLYHFSIMFASGILLFCLLPIIVVLSLYIDFSSIRGQSLCSKKSAFLGQKRANSKKFSGGFSPRALLSSLPQRPWPPEIFPARTAAGQECSRHYILNQFSGTKSLEKKSFPIIRACFVGKWYIRKQYSAVRKVKAVKYWIFEN